MSETNPNARLETFCDGVFAIAMTLLVLDIKIPSSDHIATTGELWSALQHIAPSLFTFVLSFVVILISWVNHHGVLKLVSRSSAHFIYANGFLLLTIVFIPFPTALMGEHLLTDHSTPAVVLYESVLAIQALAWIFITRTALKDHLMKSENAASIIKANRKFGYYGFVLYTVFALVGIWFPGVIAIATAIAFIFWLILGIKMKDG
jgi:uncharacterized membrane protein